MDISIKDDVFLHVIEREVMSFVTVCQPAYRKVEQCRSLPFEGMAVIKAAPEWNAAPPASYLEKWFI